MKAFSLQSQLFNNLPRTITNYTRCFPRSKSINPTTYPEAAPYKHTPFSSKPTNCNTLLSIPCFAKKIHAQETLVHDMQQELPETYSSSGLSRFMVVGAVSLGFVLVFMGFDDHKALAFGPEGPLVEEFWDNVRRYALYALTVSTGAIYTIVQPIFELLKNPISAILLLVILGGSIYIVSQVLSAMVGVTEFPYEYGY